jgi:hypothetical protein
MRRFSPTRMKAIALAIALAVPSAALAGGPKDEIYELAVVARAAGYESRAAEIEALAAGMSDADAQTLVDVGLPQLIAALRAAAQARVLAETMGVSFPSREGATRSYEQSAGFPDPDYPDPAKCTESPTGSNFDVVFVLYTSVTTARAAVEIAKDIVDLAGWGCSTVVVAIGIGGNPQTVACAIAQIALTIANGILSGFEVALDVINFCDGSIQFADVKAAVARLEHLHDDLETARGQILTRIDDHDTDIKALLATVLAEITVMQDKLDLGLKSQAEIAMHKRFKTRPSVFYEERLDEICGYAQEAINDLPVVYLAASAAQVMHDRAVQFKVTDPKRAADECIRAYLTATVRSGSIQ